MFLFSCNSADKDSNVNPSESFTSIEINPTKLLSFNKINEFPHDTSSFTEGLVFYKGELYESTGAPEELPNTKSLFGIVNLKTGNIEKSKEIDKKKYFGEGITILKGNLYQLTYKNKTGFVYDTKSFKFLGSFKYKNEEGWGLTNDSTNLIMSDGTNRITFLNPKNFEIVKELYVNDNNSKVENINELEYVNGFIYANIYTTNTIVKINSTSGKVIQKIDLTYLYQQALNKNPNSLEMNGIAYNPNSRKFYLTGKMWPYIFEGNFY